jgi:hypothetical protein
VRRRWWHNCPLTGQNNKEALVKMLRTFVAIVVVVSSIFLAARGISIDPQFFHGNRWVSLFPLFMACSYLCGRLINGEATLHIAKVTQQTSSEVRIFVDITTAILLISILIWLN